MTPDSAPPRRHAARATRIPVADVTAAFASVFAALSLAIAAAYASVPALRSWLGSEYGLVAWFTRGAFTGAVIVGVWAARRSPSDSNLRWVIPTVAAWGLLDATHYGLGLIGTHPLEIGGVAVTSTNSLADGLGRWAAELGIGPGLAASGLIAIVVLGYSLARRARSWASGRVMLTEPRVLDYLALAGCCIVATPIIGLFGVVEAVGFASRLTMMSGATLLVVAALAAGDHRRTVAGWRGRIRPWLDERTESARALEPAEDSAVLHPRVFHPGN